MALREMHVRQIPDEPPRRWFLSEQFDLILWTHPDGGFAGFELCYDRNKRERSLVWHPDTGFAQMAIDDGETSGRHMATPLLTADPDFDAKRLHAAFKRESASLPPDVARYVIGILEAHPDFATGPS